VGGHAKGIVATACVLAVLALGAGCATGGVQDGSPSAALEDLADTPAGKATPGTTTKPADTTPRSASADDADDAPTLAEMARRSADDLALLISERRRDTDTTAASGVDADASYPRAAAGRPDGGGDRVPGRAGGGGAPSDSRPADAATTADQDGLRDGVPPGATSAGADEPAAQPVVASDAGDGSSAGGGSDGAAAADPVAGVLGVLEREATDPARALSAYVLGRAVRMYASREEGGAPGDNLSPVERSVASVLDGPLRAAMAGPRADQPDRIADALDEATIALADVLPVRIADAALATDIYGFGSYRSTASHRFLAGRSNEVLLYTEPARFSSRASEATAAADASGRPGEWAVELGLELRLFNERGSMLAWRRPQERVVVTSDRRRREIYLGTRLTLPASLSVGRYRLKVILRDLADDSADERVIPIEIVADPRLAASGE